MKFKLLLLVIGFIPAIVMAQAKPANQLAVEKPFAVNPSAKPSAVAGKSQEPIDGPVRATIVEKLLDLDRPDGFRHDGSRHPKVQDKLQVVKAEATEVVEAYRNNTTHVPPPSEDTQTDTVIFNVNNIQHNITHGYQPIIKP